VILPEEMDFALPAEHDELAGPAVRVDLAVEIRKCIELADAGEDNDLAGYYRRVLVLAFCQGAASFPALLPVLESQLAVGPKCPLDLVSQLALDPDPPLASVQNSSTRYSLEG